ncbi:MAG: hypothetical protein COW01_12540 [Bdellovibrionales bacterium CG12_big_fil_rev_8_21_14_0_65_38_15]|nr:MAG: hypothetical protein COW79_05725 [Bdellovibrionales bacterium CG22_combo_CG10-13_8_21_14_all_38_13]PIQ53972.1 MAG: hypothetical protein COW01_12540 [Bdellovibrionales bacterium CG12_big_fil_rev_8_21_14_0_65_38_15]PIR31011.1 MAG: hypothetical protein COV38_03120 [Bdellovibrionales bacterium CG11_big_fil_rev_8_21_14_0_20_38_13]
MHIFINLALAFILVVQLFGNFTNYLPGAWKMFSSVEKVECSLIDSKGKSYDVYDYVYENFYIIKKSVCPEIAQFICQKELLEDSLSLQVNDLKYTTKGCDFHAIPSNP